MHKMDSALLAFITKYQVDVFRFCFYLCRNEAYAEDLAQETFIKALVNFNKIETNSKAYLFQIAKNLFIDHQRKNKNNRTYSASLTDAKTINPPDLEIWQTLFSLEQEEQDILILIDREGLSLNEASSVLGIPESALKSRLMRARENFKKKWNN